MGDLATPETRCRERIVIHRDRTFTYDGRTFRVYGTAGTDSANPGWGYEVVDVETGDRVSDGYETRAAIRDRFPDDYAGVWADRDRDVVEPTSPGTLWELHITSYRGTSVLAEHYYPSIGDGCYRVEIMRVLSRAAAKALTEKDGAGYVWKEGTQTSRFDSESDCREAAIAAFLVIAGPDDCLVTDEGYVPGSGTWLAGAERAEQTGFEWTSTDQLRERRARRLYPVEIPVMRTDGGEWVVAEPWPSPYLGDD